MTTTKKGPFVQITYVWRCPRVKVFSIFTLFWLLTFLWHRFPISLIRRALKPMTGESEESPVGEKFCSELKTFFLALPTACTCSRSSVEKITHNYSVKWWLLLFWLFHIVHLPTVAARSSGWSCRNRNCRLPEVISQSTFKSVITVSAACRSQRELEQLDEWREKWNETEINRLPLKWPQHTSSSDAQASVESFSTAPQLFWKQSARKWATPGATAHSSEPLTSIWAKTNSNRETLQ